MVSVRVSPPSLIIDWVVVELFICGMLMLETWAESRMFIPPHMYNSGVSGSVSLGDTCPPTWSTNNANVLLLTTACMMSFVGTIPENLVNLGRIRIVIG